MPDPAGGVRPECVTRVDEATGGILFLCADGFRYERLPPGTRIVWPPRPLPAIADIDGAIRTSSLTFSTAIRSTRSSGRP